MIHCNKCGKLLKDTGDDFIQGICCECKYYFKEKKPMLPPLQGWQCPVCGKVYSPFMTECNQFHGKTWSDTTTTPQE